MDCLAEKGGKRPESKRQSCKHLSCEALRSEKGEREGLSPIIKTRSGVVAQKSSTRERALSFCFFCMPKPALQFVFSTANVAVETPEEPPDTRIRPGAAHKLARTETEKDASLKAFPKIPHLQMREVDFGNDLAEANRLKILVAAIAASEEAEARAVEMRAAREKAQQEAQKRIEDLKASHMTRGLSHLDQQKRERLLQFVSQRRSAGPSPATVTRQIGGHRAAAQRRHQQEAARRIEQRQQQIPSPPPQQQLHPQQSSPTPLPQQPLQPQPRKGSQPVIQSAMRAHTLPTAASSPALALSARTHMQRNEGSSSSGSLHAKPQQASSSSSGAAPPKQQPQAAPSGRTAPHLNVTPKKLAVAGRVGVDAKLPSWMAPRAAASARPSGGSRGGGSSGSARRSSVRKGPTRT